MKYYRVKPEFADDFHKWQVFSHAAKHGCLLRYSDAARLHENTRLSCPACVDLEFADSSQHLWLEPAVMELVWSDAP